MPNTLIPTQPLATIWPSDWITSPTSHQTSTCLMMMSSQESPKIPLTELFQETPPNGQVKNKDIIRNLMIILRTPRLDFKLPHFLK